MNKVISSLFRPPKIKNAAVRSIRSFEKKDPGIRKVAGILDGHMDVHEELEDLEAEFFDLGKSQREYLREKDAANELMKYHIVRQKYFKEKYPNFLTWSDKQQIKYLHNTNPEEWTIERLSEGFPALPETIIKILKSDWVPKNANRVNKHDKSVRQNWQNFRKSNNTANLPSNLIEHLNKFTSRELQLNNDVTDVEVEDVTKRDLVQKGGEFSMIIETYEALISKSVAKEAQKNKSKILLRESTNKEDALHLNSFDSHTSNINDKKAVKQMNSLLTYNELQEEVLQNDSSLLTTETNEFNKAIRLQPEDLKLNHAKFKTSDSGMNFYKPERDYSDLCYPEHIRIPTDDYRKGCTYKLNDCYYDSDGTFLYRVPGFA